MRRSCWRNLTSDHINSEIALGAIWLLFLWKCIVKFFLDKKFFISIRNLSHFVNHSKQGVNHE